MAVPITSQIYNPITGVFGGGNVQFYSSTGVWNVPPGVGKVRARMWGAGGQAGGGFSMITVYSLTGITSIPVIVGAALSSGNSQFVSGTSSFGSYASATGGTASGNIYGGYGIGGDINNTGGIGSGGGSASLIGNGGGYLNSIPLSNTGGAGSGTFPGAITGQTGFLSPGGVNTSTAVSVSSPAGLSAPFSIDFIGTGGGIPGAQGINGGGGSLGGFPGGGSLNTAYPGAGGLVIVEW